MLIAADTFKKALSAYRVVHRLPGRLRIHIPVLEKLPRRWHAYSDRTADLITMQPGITGVDIQPLSGSLLVRYNPEQIDESDVIEWLKTVVSGFLNMGSAANAPEDKDIGGRFVRLRQRLHTHVISTRTP